jgi:thioredoxin 1
MNAAIHITDAEFEAEVLRAPILTVTDLWTEWCAPCKRLSPVLEQIAAEYAGQIKVTKMDVDANPLTPAQYDVQGLPTLLVFKDGQLVDTIVGFWPKDRLLDKLLPHLA